MECYEFLFLFYIVLTKYVRVWSRVIGALRMRHVWTQADPTPSMHVASSGGSRTRSHGQRGRGGSRIRVRLRQKRLKSAAVSLSLSLSHLLGSRFDPRFCCQLPIFILPLVSVVYQENHSTDITTAVPQVHCALRDPSFSDTNQPLPSNHHHLLMLWFHNHECP